MMDTLSRAQPTSAQLAAGSESPSASAATKAAGRRLSTDATSLLSLEGSTSSSGSMGNTTTAACPSVPSDSAAAAATATATTASPHHQTESEFGFHGTILQYVTSKL